VAESFSFELYVRHVFLQYWVSGEQHTFSHCLINLATFSWLGMTDSVNLVLEIIIYLRQSDNTASC